MGGQRAVPLHHGLIWPSFLTLPFALLQIFWLCNISQGVKPVWSLLTIKALAVLTLAAADGLLRIPPNATGLSAGEMVEVLLV